MTTITGNARFREAVAARLVLAMRPDQSITDTAVPDPQSSPTPGDYSIEVDTHHVLLQAHAFDPAKLVGPWRAETVFAVGDVIFETGIDAAALVLECTAVTGTAQTGATEPNWDTTPGNTTVDNDVTWTALGTISELSPLTQFLYQPVLLSAVNPATGSVDGGTNVSLSGSGLSAFSAANGDTITVGGNAGTNYNVVSATEITFDTPASAGGATGSVDVTITIGGESTTLENGFEYVVPVSEVVEDFETGVFSGDWAPSVDAEVQTIEALDVYSFGWGQDATDPVAGRWSPTELSGGVEISEFEFWYRERSISGGTAVRLDDSSGNPVVALGTNNPQFMVWEGATSGWREVDSGNGYDRWVRARIHNIDWSSGVFDFEFEDTAAAETVTGSGTMDSPAPIQSVVISPTNMDRAGDFNAESGGWSDQWVDDIRVAL